MSSHMDLRKFVTAEFIFGDSARLLAGRYAKNLAAKKILIVTDPGIVKVGLVDEISEILNNENLEYEIYDNVTPNPRDQEVMEGAEVYSSEECNLIIALGGGSPMDCAKGIGIVSSNKQHILEFEGVDQVSMPSPPLICIPTTAGTSADVSQFAIILDTARQVKIAIISKATVPDAALIDPRSTITMDNALTANTGFDALIHSIEAYVSNASSHITDLHALDSIKLVTENIIPTINDPQNIDLRSKMMMGSLEGGLAFSNASLGLIHAMAHSLGGLKDLAHGECNAILLEHVIDFNFDSSVKRYNQISKAMGINVEGIKKSQVKEELINTIKNLKDAAGIQANLSKLGVKEEDIGDLSKMALNDPCIVTNPKRPTAQEIEEIYRNAL